MDSTAEYKYSVSDIEHRRIEKYNPQFLGFGGVQLVYSLPSQPDIVVKVDAQELLSSISVGDTSYAESTWRQKSVEQLNQEYQFFRTIFGNNHVLKQSAHILKVPVNKRILEEIIKEYSYNTEVDKKIKAFEGNEIWSLVTFQQKTNELQNPKRLSLTGGTSERSPIRASNFEEKYTEITRKTIFDKTNSDNINSDDLAIVHRNLAKILESAATSPKLGTSLKDFVQKAIQFTTKSGDILDLAGKDNVIFTPVGGGSWNYLLCDAMYPKRGHEMIKEAKEIALFIFKDPSYKPAKVEKQILRATLNYVRVINSFASIFGIEDRVDLVRGNGAKVNIGQLLKVLDF